jgi:hypothetical protein
MTWYTLEQKTPKVGYWVEVRHFPYGSGGFTFVKDEPYTWSSLSEKGKMWRYNVPGIGYEQPGPVDGLDTESALRSLLQKLQEVMESPHEHSIEAMLGGEWHSLKNVYSYARQMLK